jgi:hypothetical protein
LAAQFQTGASALLERVPHARQKERGCFICEDFEAIVAGWLLEQEIGQLQRLAVDGKVLRSACRAEGKPLALRQPLQGLPARAA